MPTSATKTIIGLTVTGGFQYPQKTISGTITNNDGVNDLIMTIGTTEESPTFTDITTNGWLLLENLDATNYVQWGVATTVYTGRMAAGKAALLQLEPGKSLYLKANTAACRVRIVLIGDA